MPRIDTSIRTPCHRDTTASLSPPFSCCPKICDKPFRRPLRKSGPKDFDAKTRLHDCFIDPAYSKAH